MSRTIYPSPALIVLVACGIAISCASQQPQQYDPAAHQQRVQSPQQPPPPTLPPHVPQITTLRVRQAY